MCEYLDIYLPYTYDLQSMLYLLILQINSLLFSNIAKKIAKCWWLNSSSIKSGKFELHKFCDKKLNWLWVGADGGGGGLNNLFIKGYTAVPPVTYKLITLP